MKVGDLVQHIYKGAPVGTVIEIKPYVEGNRECYRVVVYWGPDDAVNPLRWDWDYDLKVAGNE